MSFVALAPVKKQRRRVRIKIPADTCGSAAPSNSRARLFPHSASGILGLTNAGEPFVRQAKVEIVRQRRILLPRALHERQEMPAISHRQALKKRRAEQGVERGRQGQV